MTDTLALSPAWDLTVDTRGNVATVGAATPGTQSGPGMRLAQDVATRLRAWRGEVWMDSQQGIDYPRYLGRTPAVAQLGADLQNEALRVPDCTTALAALDLNRTTRTLGGTLYLSDLVGNSAEVSL